MKVFVTGATGYIGSAVVNELIHAGHQVAGFARTDDGAERLRKAGAEVLRGDLDDPETLRGGAAEADGVIHLAFTNDFSNFAHALALDLHAVEAMGSALEGSGKPFIITNHMNGAASEKALFELTGLRASIVSLAPTVHGEGDRGFVPMLIGAARAKGVSAYVEDGANRWPAVHRLDAASLYRLALEKAPDGSRISGRAEEGIPVRDIAEAIGKHLNLPVVSISRAEADAHFGFLGAIAAADISGIFAGSNAQTLLDWQPAHPTLIEDLEQGHYFKQ